VYIYVKLGIIYVKLGIMHVIQLASFRILQSSLSYK